MTFQVNRKGHHQALIDSGSSDSFLSRLLVAAAKCKTVRSPQPLTWRMANGQEMTSNRQAKVELQHGNRTYRMTCWVMGPKWKDDNIILGMDFLVRYEGHLKMHKDGTVWLDLGPGPDSTTDDQQEAELCKLRWPHLYPVKRLKAEEV